MIIKGLSENGQKHFDRLTDGKDVEKLTPIDVDVMRRYCEAFARWQHAEEQITETEILVRNPSGSPVESPYVAISARYSGLCSKLEPGVRKILDDIKPPRIGGPISVNGAGMEDDFDDLCLDDLGLN